MITTRTMKFLKGVENDGTKAWIDTHRGEYDAARAEVLQAAISLIAESTRVDERIPDNQGKPRRCVSRLNRDARFAKGKSDYKSEFFIMLYPMGKAASVAAYYLHVQPGRSYAGGGAFNPPLETLNSVREAIAADPQQFRRLLATHAVKSNFPEGLTTSGTLQQAPRGFSAEHPAIELLKLKGYCFNHPLTDSALKGPKATSEIVQAWKAAKPLVDFINRAARDTNRPK